MTVCAVENYMKILFSIQVGWPKEKGGFQSSDHQQQTARPERVDTL